MNNENETRLLDLMPEEARTRVRQEVIEEMEAEKKKKMSVPVTEKELDAIMEKL